MLMLPFPYIANTTGWMTAEVGRQPWVIYGLMRTAEGVVAVNVSAGNTHVHTDRLHGRVHGA